MAKPNYRHQKKQKELARKTRHAEKQKKRLGREDEMPQDGSAADATTTATAGTSEAGIMADKS